MKPAITLIFPNSPFLIDTGVFPPLGILYLSSFLKQHDIAVQCLDMGAGHTKDMAESDTIGISITTPQKEEAFNLAHYYKKQGKRLIAGGAHATHMPNECFDAGFDFVVNGYGEHKLLNILNDNGYHKKPNINEIPFPDRDALPIKDYKYFINGRATTPIMTSRGCFGACSFCAKIDKTFKMQNADRTVDEILHINKKYGFDAFMIYDDVFIAKKSRFRNISERLKDKNFLFRCFARTNLIDDEICELMNQMGIVEVGLGAESGSDTILKNNMKGTTVETNTIAVKMLQKHGIRAKTFIIIGLPGESKETLYETERWINETKPDDVDFTIFQPMPGSDIFKNTNKYDIIFNYNGNPSWYKGTPGKYNCNISTSSLTSKELLYYRDHFEEKYKNQELLR